MGMLDALVGPMGGQIASAIASRVGVSPEIAQTAIAALTRAHPQPGDTVGQAAGETGLSPDLLHNIVGQLGGEGGLGQLAGMASGQQPQEGGGVGGGLGGLLGGLLGR